MVFTWTKHWLELQNINHKTFEEIPSTNTFAKNYLNSQKKPLQQLVFLAKKQTAGRGRGENLWLHSDLMLTWLYPSIKNEIPSNLSTLLVIDVKKALEKLAPTLPYLIKKPNDLYLENRKIAGLLLEITEEAKDQYFIIGLGLNVFSHPQNLKAGDLSSFLKTSQEETQLSERKWFLFLEELQKLWAHTILSLSNK